MSEAHATPDLSRIVNLIMENPKLIEEIANLAKKDGEEAAENATSVAAEAKKEIQTSTTLQIKDGKERRSKLLNALKPYVSEGRAKAIDSMLTISEMLEVMKAR